MKGKKILATLVVLAMVLSTMVVLYKLDIKIVEEAEAIKGVTEWGYPRNVTTQNLVYNAATAVNIDINTTGLASTSYYLYYPYYGRIGSTYDLTWHPYLSSGGAQKSITVASPGTDETLSGIYLNRSGMWVLNPTELTGVINCNDATNFSNTVSKWFWVNSSTTYTMTVSPDEVYYGNNETIVINVRNADGDLTYCWVDVRQERNESEVPSFPNEAASPNGIWNFSSSWKTRLRYGGNYTVIAWYDSVPQPLYQSLGYGYNSTFGQSPAITANYYDYLICGPWDPPEYNTSYYSRKLVCHPGVPTTSIPVANQIMYWSFDGQVSISVKNYDGGNISNLDCTVWNSDDVNITANLTIDTSDVDKGWVNISNKDASTVTNGSWTGGWGRDNATNVSVYGKNGTWYAYLFKNVDGDSENKEEWNTTVYFTVASASKLQWKWIDDDGGLSGDDNDGLIPVLPDYTAGEQPVNISFQIIGDDHLYYGDTAGANAPSVLGKNITVSGDALYLSKTLDKLPGVTYASNTWTVPLTPTMALNGGEIAFTVSWSGKGSITETLDVGGTGLNGTIVTISPIEFTVGENVTLTVTVKGATGYPYPNAQVYLHYVYHDGTLISTAKGGLIDSMLGGGNTNGEYIFLINTTQQTTNQTAYSADPDGYTGIRAPRNISAYVKLYRGGAPTYIHGYALTTMKAKKDLKVTMEPNIVMAGQKNSKVYFNTTIVDSAGNTTGYPADLDLKVRIFNESGTDVTASIGNLVTGTGTHGTDGNDNKTATNIYLQKPGTYIVYAYNNTHNSEGNNATLVVTPVEVTSSLSELIWNVDKNVSVTFTVKYNGEPVNGTLTIDNVSTVGTTYNKTWTDCSFAPQVGATGYTHAGSDTSKSETITNGVVTVYNITANYLPPEVERKNITFYFKPKTPSGNAWAWASGIIPVKIADVTAKPASLPYNKPAILEITTSGRGTGLPNVWVSILIPGLTGEMNTTTDANGKATFAFTPPTTGNIIIKIENRTSTTKVSITSWALYLDAPSQANEGVEFTVTIRNNTATGTGVVGAAVAFAGETKTTDSSGQTTFTAPAVTTNREYTITATKEGYAEDAATILILNKPKLIIVAPSEANTGSAFEVIIADDAGNSVVGATVAINDVTYTAGANGIAMLTAPSEEGLYVITATFPGYTNADEVTIKIVSGGIPGFELLTLIAAIGVAFILLKRRRN